MITIIAAMDANNLIGSDNALPWHIPDDLKHFKRMTKGHPIIMGRMTYESLPVRPLPGRTNIVISRTLHEDHSGTKFLTDVTEALDYGLKLSDEVFVIGGERIYGLMMEMADRLVITHVNGEFNGNKFFPMIDPEIWVQTLILENHDNFVIIEYRKNAQPRI